MGAMTPSELKRLTAQGEGPELEFKRSTGELRQAMESMCGMLNASGRGAVLFGVSNQGKVIGQDVAESTVRAVSNESRKIEPAAQLTPMSVAAGKGRSVLVVDAVAREPGPHTYDGRAFIRVGNTTQRMSRPEYDRRVRERLEAQLPWDQWVAPDWKVLDLDLDEVRSTVGQAVEAQRLAGMIGDERPETILRRLDLATDRGLTRAAAILFGKEGGPGYPMGEVRLARFRGTTKDEFRDNRQFKGHAFSLLRHAESFLQDHVPVASTFTPGRMRREDRPLYPPLAVREALVNALVHRDYSIHGGAVSVALFDDRLEIWSAGRLPEGLTPEMLKGTHDSVLRNPTIAGVFHRRGLVEQWGRGTNKILAEAEKAGCPEPEFEEVGASFVVRFRSAVQAAEERPPAAAELSPRAEKILAVLGELGPMGASDLHGRLAEDITLRALQKELKRLKESGRIEVRGRGKATVYQLKERPE